MFGFGGIQLLDITGSASVVDVAHPLCQREAI